MSEEKPRVLYIEDDSNSRALIARVLSMEFQVWTASNGLEGLNLLKQYQPDIVITDMNLPDLNGEILATRIRATSNKPIPIIATTIQIDRAFKARASAAGFVGYLRKPIDVMTIRDTIRDYIGGRVEKVDAADHRRASQEIQGTITEMLEKTLRQVQEDNATLQNLERAKTAFLTQVSHELRTPLTVLSGYAQMLDQQLSTDGPITGLQRQLSDLTVESIRRLHNLMGEINVMARLASNELETQKAAFRIGDVLDEAAKEYEQAFQDRKISYEPQGSGWDESIVADATLIRMAISNLLSNAIKATPNGGKVTVSAQREGRMLNITVRDTGIGIAADQMPLLFKPFFTAIDVSRGKTSKTQFMGMGMGMGLTIVTKIVEAHHGQVWADSPGYDEQRLPGSAFHMLLPVNS